MEYFLINQLPSDEHMSALAKAHNEIFNDAHTVAALKEELERVHSPLFQYVVVEGIVVAFKIGYEEKKHRFYSWLGGVLPSFRGQGIARELMSRQHQWCKENGYKVLRTKTLNKWKAMLILNLKSGFDIIGTYIDGKGQTKLILQKEL